MNRYERNIQQIRERGESAEMYFLDKTMSECVELKDEVINFKSSDMYRQDLLGEIADVLNCIIYLIILFKLDIFKIIRIMCLKVDRGYERGEVEDD